MPAPTQSAGGSGGTTGTAGSDNTSGGSTVIAGSGSVAGSGGTAPTGPTSDIIDDLEDNDGRILVTQGRQGSWYAFSDGTITPGAPDDAGNTNGFTPGSPGAGSASTPLT